MVLTVPLHGDVHHDAEDVFAKAMAVAVPLYAADEPLLLLAVVVKLGGYDDVAVALVPWLDKAEHDVSDMNFGGLLFEGIWPFICCYSLKGM